MGFVLRDSVVGGKLLDQEWANWRAGWTVLNEGAVPGSLRLHVPPLNNFRLRGEVSDFSTGVDNPNVNTGKSYRTIISLAPA